MNTYNFHALPAWWLRDGVLDETKRLEALCKDKHKSNK